MRDVAAILQKVSGEGQDLARLLFKQYLSEIRLDTEDFLRLLEPSLDRLIRDYDTGSIAVEEVRFVVHELTNSAPMPRLRGAGLPQAAVDQFLSGLGDILFREATSGTDSGGPKFQP